MGDVEKLAELIRERNRLDHEISMIISSNAGGIIRAAEKGHIAEWIASMAFSITLNPEKNKKDYDGTFNGGEYKGRKVDVKFHPVNEHSINLNPKVEEDVYLLVMTGPYKPAGSSKNRERPFCITNVYLFNERKLCELLTRDDVKVGIASSVKKKYWDEYEIYPENRKGLDTGMNKEVLKLFSCGEC